MPPKNGDKSSLACKPSVYSTVLIIGRADEFEDGFF
jgi:hypothetical protein